MGMQRYVEAMTGSKLSSADLLENDERTDQVSMLRRQGTLCLRAISKITNWLQYDSFDADHGFSFHCSKQLSRHMKPGATRQVTSRKWAEPDRLDAQLPLRWLQGETGKTPAFVISVMSG
ncbi:hypothetical protein AJ87_38960 [Rhizobium yanglingense]|nr:hypothetical protein AJ87_38960 [Rhizobium yanglingense]